MNTAIAAIFGIVTMVGMFCLLMMSLVKLATRNNEVRDVPYKTNAYLSCAPVDDIPVMIDGDRVLTEREFTEGEIIDLGSVDELNDRLIRMK